MLRGLKILFMFIYLSQTDDIWVGRGHQDGSANEVTPRWKTGLAVNG
jgi:hypothetical protein